MAIQNIQVDIEISSFQTALERAAKEEKSIGQVIGQFLIQYAKEATTTYTIQSGDTLSKIANKVYGNASKYPLIQQANNITNPSQIWVGQVLTIPSIPDEVTPAPFSPSPPPIPLSPVSSPPDTNITNTTNTIIDKPQLDFVGSPNFNNRRNPNDITAITIHATANRTLQGVVNWFNNPNAQVSAHYTIDKDGTIAQHVQDGDRAWHAGRSKWKERPSCNDYCIGIELVNLNNGQDSYPEAQHKANLNLCVYLCSKYNISPEDIMAHYDIALPKGRKSDPRGYDMNGLRREVAAILGH